MAPLARRILRASVAMVASAVQHPKRVPIVAIVMVKTAARKRLEPFQGSLGVRTCRFRTRLRRITAPCRHGPIPSTTRHTFGVDGVGNGRVPLQRTAPPLPRTTPVWWRAETAGRLACGCRSIVPTVHCGSLTVQSRRGEQAAQAPTGSGNLTVRPAPAGKEAPVPHSAGALVKPRPLPISREIVCAGPAQVSDGPVQGVLEGSREGLARPTPLKRCWGPRAGDAGGGWRYRLGLRLPHAPYRPYHILHGRPMVRRNFRVVAMAPGDCPK
jgi:hypothetical protein